MKKFVFLALLIIFTVASFAKATITVSVWSWNVDRYKKLVAEFNKYYPDIEVKIIVNEPDINGFLTATVSAKKALPDVVAESWEPLSYPVSQGWVYPLDEFFKDDPYIKYVPDSVRNAFKYNNKTYALGERLHFECIVLNLDLLKKLNLTAPTYENWTVDLFKNYARRATTKEYSGINQLWEFDTFMAAILSKETTFWSFDPDKWEFDLVNGGWIPAIKLQKELKSIPGLVADDLINQDMRNQGQLDDYQKKFGKDADAFRESKVLMGFEATYDWSWLRTVPWNFDYYPVPHDPKIGIRLPVHINYTFVSSTTKYPKEAFLFARFLTYDPRGVVARLKLYESEGVENGRLTDWFIPATMHPDVVKYFETLKIPNGIKWMLKNLDKTVRVDMWKIVPGWFEAIWDVIFPVNEKIRRGETTPEAVAKETQDKANKVIKESWTIFAKKLADAEKKFPQIRKQIEGK
ncbi:MAG: extracellular solute-binding protein [Fervidobacterium sp.]|uniref:Carbohydrate ABC transporter substrate-binding protein, CUT1 family n=1 Tax=Fervidobacterium gondwanense DSM 13020 TaxID=1121883 RepID=A0A1M7S4G9_FERGO|nr:extracellular solute-binding protein [Fervidobacterium gondwanense]UXF00767.1 ABC transporter substrate-binding protein [Fervidobacterium riparium]SHN53192.1 carbohydrate ABC transporter substrate-binding protein, CUT1 family [Fervidobacterium gondwanense DSM 13020]